MSSLPRIGIYAGTFNPIHTGHISFAHQAVIQAKLEKVYFLVEPRPRYKQAVKALMHRERMVELAIADDPRLGTIHLPDKQFTIEGTLPKLLHRFADAQLVMLFGEDVVRHLADWPHINELIDAVDFIIGARQQTTAEISASLETLENTRGHRFDYDIIETTDNHVSSTYVRHQLRLGKVPHSVPEAVAAYIKAHRLYAPVHL